MAESEASLSDEAACHARASRFRCARHHGLRRGLTAPAAAPERADLVVLNGKVHVGDEGRSVAEAVAVKGGIILRTGTTDEIRTLAGPQTRSVDACGGTGQNTQNRPV